MKNCILLFFGISIVIFSCKKKPLEPVFTQNNNTPNVGMVYPKRIEIEDSILKSKATIYVTYTADSLVSSIKREINTPNASLDSTLEQNFTYEGKNVKTITTRWEYQPAGIKSNVYTEEKYNYAQNRILNYQLITHNYGGVEPDTRDTVKYDYYVLKKSDGLDYYSFIINKNGFKTVLNNTFSLSENSKNNINFEPASSTIEEIVIPEKTLIIKPYYGVSSSYSNIKYISFKNPYNPDIIYDDSFKMFKKISGFYSNNIYKDSVLSYITGSNFYINCTNFSTIPSKIICQLKLYSSINHNLYKSLEVIINDNVFDQLPQNSFYKKEIILMDTLNYLKSFKFNFKTEFNYLIDSKSKIEKIKRLDYFNDNINNTINYTFHY